ncbi:lipid II:glycine glycyltransferase FemX [Sporosarcina sp. G11-34]|uniref:lipid II:glycine glycyltransferase FemX n=1 Tax=Sporosarcina sp. G11-34 TaxID=2849605 RepID=UPI0022A9C1FE|nr:GNAT family N-acetyltransferase [Sporosarcina sp. G11-34]MCZ2258631.1 GNAT family N-acetyltransferase [Sporosarcina sp. G11-34]
MLKVISWENHAQWNNIINSFMDEDVYFSYEYFASSLLIDLGEPILFYYEDENGRVAYPVVKRKIENIAGEELYDITTPYGYGGPLVSYLNEEKELLYKFRMEINKYCNKNDIVSEFVRFHPVLGNEKNLEKDLDLDVIYIRNTIEMKLQQGEELLSEIPGKTRNMIRKAIRNGVEVKKLDKDESIKDFLAIYHSTMNRNDAADYYYFNENYFKETFELLNPNIHMFGAFVEEKIIAATLIFTYGDFMHYHLSGALREHLSLGANNLLLYEIAEWGRKQGMESFHLGGGYFGNEDGLYRFKKSFSQLEPLNFYIGKKIHNEDLYRMLVSEKGITEDNGFFPLYRK